MSITRIRRACAVLVLAGIGVVGTAGAAGAAITDTAAAPATPVVAAAPAAAADPAAPTAGGEVQALAAVEFDRVMTAALWGAAMVSKVAFVQTCALTPPLWRSACDAVANWVFDDFRRLGAPNGRCLEVYSRWGWPPIGVRYKNC